MYIPTLLALGITLICNYIVPMWADIGMGGYHPQK